MSLNLKFFSLFDFNDSLAGNLIRHCLYTYFHMFTLSHSVDRNNQTTQYQLKKTGFSCPIQLFLITLHAIFPFNTTLILVIYNRAQKRGSYVLRLWKTNLNTYNFFLYLIGNKS